MMWRLAATRNQSTTQFVLGSVRCRSNNNESRAGLQRLKHGVVNNDNKPYPRHRNFSTTTYYDSQSGIHVPIHNENEITLIIDKGCPTKHQTAFIPPQLYKEDMSSDMPDILQDFVKHGIHGIRIPPLKFPKDVRNLKVLSNIVPSTSFYTYVPMVPHSQKLPTNLSGVSIILDFQSLLETSKEGETEDENEAAPASSYEGFVTTIALGEEECSSGEPISIANQVATLIDTRNIGDYLWLSHNEDVDADDVIQLYEELIYLDVPGPTVKSRLIVQTSDDDLIDEAMMSGINKFVIENESQIRSVEEIAKDQGKEILRSV